MKKNHFKKCTQQLAILSSFALAPQIASAYPGYVNQIPNLMNVPDVSVMGCDMCHNSPNGADARNIFGETVELHQDGINVDWPSVCAIDSDGDGFTNGQELADPNCEWVANSAQPAGDVFDPRDPMSHPESNDPPLSGTEPEVGGMPMAGEMPMPMPMAGEMPMPMAGVTSMPVVEDDALDSTEETGCEASGIRTTSALSLLILILAFLGLRRIEQR